MEKQQSRVGDLDNGEMKQIEDIISDLKKSPVFNMSLASKELFHSNFIAWILEVDGVDSTPLLKLFFKDNSIVKSDFKKVDREISNFDIRIWLKDGRSVVVENKVKSLPYKEQLEKYSAVLNKDKKSDPTKTTCVLLSLTMPDFFSNEGTYETGSNYNWRLVNYSTLKKALGDLKSTYPYSLALIDDYTGFIDNLCRLYGECIKSFDDEVASLDSTLYEQLKEIRLHDVYGKWHVASLKKCLETKYKTKLRGVTLTTDYGSGGGILNIDPKNVSGTKKWKKIQIQSGQLRQVLQYKAKGNSKIFKEAHDLMKNEEWFFIPKKGWHGTKCNDEEPRNDYGFCKYGKGDKAYFSYRYETEWDIARIIELAKDVKIIKE